MLKRIITSFIVICLLGTAAVAFASYSTYNVTLRPTKLDATLKQGQKTTGYNNVLHKDIKLGGEYDALDVWIDRKVGSSDWSRVSDNVTCYQGGGPYTVYSDYDLKTGESIRVRGQNHDWTPVNVSAHGSIDLR